MTTREIWDIIMRFSPSAIALSACLAIMSSASLSKRADFEVVAASTKFVESGDNAFSAGNIDEAQGLYETALAIDPRNRNAYVALARLLSKRGLYGKSIRFYNEALEIDPNDLTTLSEQANVMLSKGAVKAARKNLARLRILCRSDCEQVEKLALSIDAAGKKPALQASAVEINPTAEQEKKN